MSRQEMGYASQEKNDGADAKLNLASRGIRLGFLDCLNWCLRDKAHAPMAACDRRGACQLRSDDDSGDISIGRLAGWTRQKALPNKAPQDAMQYAPEPSRMVSNATRVPKICHQLKTLQIQKFVRTLTPKT